MRPNRIILAVCIALSVFISGCASINPVANHYGNVFDEFNASHKYLVQSTSIKKSFPMSFDDVWNNALYVLAQHAIIVDASRESGTITYIRIDGVYFGDAFTEDLFYYWEFPFTAFIDREPQGSTVFVYPMKNLYNSKYKNMKWWNVVNNGFDHIGEEFLERLSTQLSVKEKWQWLRE